MIAVLLLGYVEDRKEPLYVIFKGNIWARFTRTNLQSLKISAMVIADGSLMCHLPFHESGVLNLRRFCIHLSKRICYSQSTTEPGILVPVPKRA